MTHITAGEAQERLDALLESVSEPHEPLQIKGERYAAVLVSGEDWRAIQEALYLTSIPGMRESIIQGRNNPIEKCSAAVWS